eukprot:TRINITY_DN3582_c0_g1_i1.p1 TRINITY_DN3582_c0_g1~~TRINITY_DN3582_c0_g1_i1.p1  ORF type:complete len:401 (-),score=50.68 TRINITY_DN3582_c0_g1_i1:44-1246(-)
MGEGSSMHNDDTALCLLQSSLQLDPSTQGTVDGVVPQSMTPWRMLFISAVLVIMMIAVMPLLDYISGKRSKIRIAQLIMFYVWNLGGAVLFCYHFNFASSHFSGARHLNFSESVYLMTQIVLTIGYGDVVPVGSGRLFMAVFVLVSTLMVADILLGFVRLALKRFEAVVRMIVFNLQALVSTSELKEDASKLWWLGCKPQVTKRVNHVLAAMGSFAGMCFLWSLIYVEILPHEQYSWKDAFYNAVITFTTVGFGALTVNTPLGQVLACPLMLFGVASMAYLVFAVSRLMDTLEQSETWCENKSREHLEKNVKHMMEEFRMDDDAEVSQAEFLVLGLLQGGIVNKEHLSRINAIYASLKSPVTGKLSKEQLFTGHTTLNVPKKSALSATGHQGVKASLSVQ